MKSIQRGVLDPPLSRGMTAVRGARSVPSCGAHVRESTAHLKWQDTPIGPLAHFKATGEGWHGRINEALKKAAGI